MVRIITTVFLIVSFALTWNCTRKAIPVSSKEDTYSEDLSGLRPEIHEYQSPEPFQITRGNLSSEDPEFDVTNELKVILDSMTEINKRTQFTQFTIQVHNSSSREAADSARFEVFRILPDSKPILEFLSPSYRVKVGRYYNQLEAYQTLLKLKKQFPNAIVIPERVFYK